MAIHDYKCEDCGKKFEEIVFSSDIKAQCPECNSLKVKPLVSAHGGYKFQSGPSSVRPRGAGSFKRGRK